MANRRRIEPMDIVQHRIFGWQGLVLTIICEDDGYADVFREGYTDLERRVPLCFLEYKGN